MKNLHRRYYVLLPAIAFLFCAYSFANAASVTTAVIVTLVPNAPSNFTAVPDSQTQVTLSWTDNSNDFEDGFSIERKTGIGGTYAVIGTTGTGISTYTDNTASAGTTYFYRVDAFSGSQVSGYSNEASVTTPNNSTPPSNPSGGGGGGGGGFSASSSADNVTISGFAYPLSQVTILQNGVQVIQTIAGPDGIFFASINNLSAGSYNFYVYATDSAGRRSTPFTFPVSVTTGATTNISGVFLSPTIGVDKQEVKQGDPIAIFGEALPSAPVEIQVDSAVPMYINTTSTASGTYLYDLDTSRLALGSHVAKSEAKTGGMISDYSIAQAFTVGNTNVTSTPQSACPPKGDLNGDCRVNLIDFSILAYWYGQPTPIPALYLLDGASTVDLTDFSILAYYWTG